MASDEEKKLLMEPREASLLEIFQILFRPVELVESKSFIKAVKVKPEMFEQRRILFLSMFFQKLLQYGEKPLSLFGSGFEMFLNVPRPNQMLMNFFRGNPVVPDKKSVNFLSTIGHLDNRMDLDKNIKPRNNKYFAALSVMASKLAYENSNVIEATVQTRWKMKLLGAYECWDEGHQDYTTQCFMFHDTNTTPDMIVVAFRGTEPFNADDWSTDLDISWYKPKGLKGRVHRGFMKALGLKLDGTWPKNSKEDHGCAYSIISEKLKSHFEINKSTKFIVTGHSLGGALAVLFPAVLAMHEECDILERLDGVYTFGQPRVGDGKFGKLMRDQFKQYGVKYYRFVYSHDVVPRLPFDDSAMMFKHFGTCIYINTFYEAMILEEEPYKNYVDWVAFVEKRVDAMWELVRSFLLPDVFGPDFKENRLMKMGRMVGLAIPGLPAHSLNDYINATRLANYY